MNGFTEPAAGRIAPGGGAPGGTNGPDDAHGPRTAREPAAPAGPGGTGGPAGGAGGPGASLESGGAGGGTIVIRLGDRSGGVDQVRRAAARQVVGGRWEPFLDDVRLVVSELTTNALLHGAPPVEVRILTGGPTLRIEVGDASRVLPVRPPVGGDALTGRGMALVAAAAHRWGVSPQPSGKIVWAEFDDEHSNDLIDAGGPASGPPSHSDAQVGDGSAGPVGRGGGSDQAGGVGQAGGSGGFVGTGGMGEAGAEIRGLAGIRGVSNATLPMPGLPLSSPGFLVRLGDVPTALLLGAKNHVDGLVREFALAAGGAASGASGALPERLGELLRTVTNRFSGPRQAIKRQALAAAAAGRPRTPLELVLPPSAAGDAEQYLAALEEIETYARAARLLTVESPPQHVAFRRWYIGSLVEQLRAAERGQADTALARSFEQYLLDTLDSVVAAQRTAERAARLARVTTALARATTAEQVAAAVVSEGAAVLGASGGVLLIPQGAGRMAIPGSVGYGESMVAALRAERLTDRLPAADALRTGEPVWLESRRERDARYPDLAELEPTAVAMCVLPLFAGERTLGALRFSFDHSRLFDDDERSFVEALAAQTGLALERARLFFVERAARERTTLFAAATDLFTSTLDTARILEHLVGLLVPWHATRAAACRIDDDGGVQIVAVADRADLTPSTASARDPIPAPRAVPAPTTITTAGSTATAGSPGTTGAAGAASPAATAGPSASPGSALSVTRPYDPRGALFASGDSPTSPAAAPVPAPDAPTGTGHAWPVPPGGPTGTGHAPSGLAGVASPSAGGAAHPEGTSTGADGVAVGLGVPAAGPGRDEEGIGEGAAAGEIRRTVPIRRAVPDRHGMTQALRTGRPARAPDGTRLALPLVLGGQAVAAVGLIAADGHVYEDDDHRVIAELVDRATVAIGNARQYEQERRTAVTLQRSLLPQRLPDVPGVGFAWRYLPGTAGALVGGDWYDVLPVDDGRIALVIGDVMGHGIHAAATMGQLRAAGRAHIVDHANPGAVLTQLDAAAARLEQGQIATAALAVYDPSTARLVVASAGHLPPLLIPPGAPARYVPVDPGPPLNTGLPDYPEIELTVPPGSILLLFTDGLVEDRARPVDEGMELLRALVTADGSPDEICDRALAGLGRSTGHEDDTALLAVRFGAPPG